MKPAAAQVHILSLGQLDFAPGGLSEPPFQLLRQGAAPLNTLLAAHAPDIRGIITASRIGAGPELIAQLPNLEIIANCGVGYDSVDVVAAAAAGVIVTNTPDVLNEEMADFTIGLLLATIRQLPQADRFIRAGSWRAGRQFPLSPTLRGRKIGIAGMGRIGKAVARRLSGFELPISYYGRQAQNLPYQYFPSLPALAAAVDTLIVVLPGGAATRHAVDAPVLAALGPQGVLINVARGSVVDEPALISALASRAILAAGLDVFAHEPAVPEALLRMEQVVLLPHIGTSTHATRDEMFALVVRNLVSWFTGRGPLTPVPETPWQPPGP
jgi:lactate dehydrogenase-like 2-hydroxyacid dehydrogenase